MTAAIALLSTMQRLTLQSSRCQKGTFYIGLMPTAIQTSEAGEPFHHLLDWSMTHWIWKDMRVSQLWQTILVNYFIASCQHPEHKESGRKWKVLVAKKNKGKKIYLAGEFCQAWQVIILLWISWICALLHEGPSVSNVTYRSENAFVR